ncbi:alpha/beta hydrolase fold domain-containing protein [Mucilaginibacter polytrichastri]|uniref:Alpha/beta hydrolase fold-3 domain-containing protein n=1 Tax=Mucilaginibacter polytrichastri TaxID=1302689 RepID=A0A1Q6A425_9SPHI|nr:alpha/beta hydrolase fold domain-containing protein [Mucilaginibacter polytrichastri]OKS88758.1 hypothetical protein RG47T_4236 [Mucilaginibacter polytrichastri]SFT05315.1 Acetyl esterase/lipase [Mucilaginibacter polytrichastri]
MTNSKKILAVAVMFTLMNASCSRKISITPQQAATMSRPSVDTLKNFKVIRLPIIKPSDKLLIKARGQFGLHEAGELKDMMARFNPLITDTIIGDVKVKIITPVHINPAYAGKIAIYIHGGGFIMGSPTDRTSMLMANEMGIKTFSIDYSLAPEAKFPVAMNECVTVYRHLVQQYQPQNITCWSISAGCTHMLAMLIKAKQDGLPMINSMALLSPAADISGNGDAVKSNDGRDILGYRNQADKMFAAPFAGNASLTDPLVSPVYATYPSDFPATILATSTRDLFLSNAVRTHWKIRNAGGNAELLVAEGMWHAFQSYPDLPEAAENRKAVQQFLYYKLVQADTAKNTALVKRFIIEVINGQKFELLGEIWAQDMIWHGGSMGDITGLPAYKKMMEASVSGSFSAMHLSIRNIIASGNKVVVYFQNSGKNIGPFMGNKATGKHAAWDGMGIYRISNGKIAEAWFSEDLLSMFQQLGFLKSGN